MSKTKRVTVREAARLAGKTIQTVYMSIWQGRIKALRVDGKWFIGPKDVELLKRGHSRG